MAGIIRQVKSGFTIIELLVVVFIVAILATVAAPRITNLIEGTQGTVVKDAVAKLNNATNQFVTAGGRFIIDGDYSGDVYDVMDDAFTGDGWDEEMAAMIARFRDGGVPGGGETPTPNGVIRDTRLSYPFKVSGLVITDSDPVQRRLGINGVNGNPAFWLWWDAANNLWAGEPN